MAPSLGLCLLTLLSVLASVDFCEVRQMVNIFANQLHARTLAKSKGKYF